MSQAINIRRDVADQFYRYKMPKIVVKVEGRGNGIRTVVVNVQDVARSLARPASYLIKYFGYEIGTQSLCDETNSKFMLTGTHTADYLQNVLDGFIKGFVLCSSCFNPETDLSIARNGKIQKGCKACGKTTEASNGHKLCSYIQKNTPEAFDAVYARNTAEADDQRNEVDLDMSAFSIGNGLPEGALEESSIPEGEDPFVDVLEVFASYLEENPSATFEAILQKGASLGISKHKQVTVLAQMIFTDEILSQIPKFAPLFKELLVDEKTELAFLGATERFVTLHYPELLKRIFAIFSAYYQQELVCEKTFLLWQGKPSRRYVSLQDAQAVRAAAKPFFDWLAAADSDEE